MPSPTDPPARAPRPPPEALRRNICVTAEIFALALLAASGLHIMENLLPRIPLFPWMRVGFSYVVILPFLLRFGAGPACALFVARNAVAVLYGGQPLTTFLIGTGSGVAAFLLIGPFVSAANRKGWLGILGASVLMAAAFNLCQLIAVNAALIRHAGFYFQTGPILAWSLFSGAAVALLIRGSHGELAALLSPLTASVSASRSTLPPAPPAPFLCGMALLILLVAAPITALQAAALLVLLLAVPGRFRILLQAWPFFFYLAWLHLFHTSGAFIAGDWITREGLDGFVLHAARLAALILLGRWLTRRFPWQWARDPRSVWLQGFLLALPLMADLFPTSLAFGREAVRRLRARKGGVFAPAFAAWREKMEAAARNAVAAAGSTVGISPAEGKPGTV